MSANVESMFSASNLTPWHGVGIVLPEGLKAAEAIKSAGLDWDVKKSPSYHMVNGIYTQVPDTFHLVRQDKFTVLGTVGNGYNVFQNNSAFDFADAFVEAGDAKYETAGSLCGGKRVWMMMKVNGQMRIKGTDDVIDKFLFITNGHDGMHSVEIGFCTIRIVCSNTLNLARAEAKKAGNLFKMRHSANIKGRVQEAKDALGIINKQFDNFNDLINAMAQVKMNKKAVDSFLGKMGFDKEANPRDEEVMNDITALFEAGKGNTMKGVKGTLWALVNGVTEYVDHEKGTRVTKSFGSEEEARFYSSQFGTGAQMKEEALEQAIELVA